MALRIERKKDSRLSKCILHRVADIPGGVTVSTAGLGGAVLSEGTPIGKGSNGLYAVCKTAKVLTKAEASATNYEVNKGHLFNVGDRFATDKANGKTIKSIDKSDAAKDVITLDASLGVEVKVGSCAFESAGDNKNLKVEPIAVTGSSYDIAKGDNIFVDAWLHAVVSEGNAPAVNDTIKSALKCVSYV